MAPVKESAVVPGDHYVSPTRAEPSTIEAFRACPVIGRPQRADGVRIQQSQPRSHARPTGMPLNLRAASRLTCITALNRPATVQHPSSPAPLKPSTPQAQHQVTASMLRKAHRADPAQGLQERLPTPLRDSSGLLLHVLDKATTTAATRQSPWTLI